MCVWGGDLDVLLRCLCPRLASHFLLGHASLLAHSGVCSSMVEQCPVDDVDTVVNEVGQGEHECHLPACFSVVIAHRHTQTHTHARASMRCHALVAGRGACWWRRAGLRRPRKNSSRPSTSPGTSRSSRTTLPSATTASSSMPRLGEGLLACPLACLLACFLLCVSVYICVCACLCALPLSFRCEPPLQL